MPSVPGSIPDVERALICVQPCVLDRQHPRLLIGVVVMAAASTRTSAPQHGFLIAPHMHSAEGGELPTKCCSCWHAWL